MEDPAAFWDAQAASFDDEPDHGLRDAPVREAWLTLLDGLLPPAPARVLDLGCGTGSLSVLLAQQGHAVTGLDISALMIDAAVDKARARSVSVDFMIGDAADPGVPPSSADVVLARHVLWALPDPAAVLHRWQRLLADGGRLVLIEGRWSTGAGLTAEETLALVHRCGRTAQVRALSDERYWGGPIEDERYVVVSPADAMGSG